MAFRVGQQVGCTNGDGWYRLGDGVYDGPKKGAVLKITGVYTRPIGQFLSFAEWPGDGFISSCFRPIVTRKTDISVFKALLNPVREREEA